MDKDFFSARVEDTADICERTSAPKFLGFLTEEEQAEAECILKRRGVQYKLWGGYSEAQRQLLCCYPEWCENPDFPIKAVTASFRFCDSLSHRDFLGALMGLGIKREAVGDILIESGRAVIFLTEEISGFVVSELDKAGRVGITVNIGFSSPLPSIGERAYFSDTIASARLDCVVAAVCSLSRNAAAEKISAGLVSVNGLPTEKATKALVSGDAVTVRGRGKFFIESVSDFSKKGRIILKYSKYI